MRRHLHTLSVLALPFIVLLTVSIAVTDEGAAQDSCCFLNTCEVFQDNGPEEAVFEVTLQPE
jgi:hypothetical protein